MVPNHELAPGEIAELASEVIAALVAGAPIPDAPAQWLKSGMAALLAGHDVRAALGLKKRHGKRAEKGVQLAARNDKIRRLVLSLEGSGAERADATRRALEILAADQPPPDRVVNDGTRRTRKPVISLRTVQRILAEPNEKPAAAATLDTLLCRWSSAR